MVLHLAIVYEKQSNLAAALPPVAEAAQIAERMGMPDADAGHAYLEELRAGMSEGSTWRIYATTG
jgi:hypothetical protein